MWAVQTSTFVEKLVAVELLLHLAQSALWLSPCLDGYSAAPAE